MARLLGEQPEDRELQHVMNDISNRYIDASIGPDPVPGRAVGRVVRRARVRGRQCVGGGRKRSDRRFGCCEAFDRPARTYTFRRCRASPTTRWPAGRFCAISGGARSPASTCATPIPELLRAAQFIGTDIDDECPVCGATNLRLVSYVYGEKLKQANGRAISNQAELRKLGASCDEFACYDVEVCVECRWNHLRRQSLHGRLHAS